MGECQKGIIGWGHVKHIARARERGKGGVRGRCQAQEKEVRETERRRGEREEKKRERGRGERRERGGEKKGGKGERGGTEGRKVERESSVQTRERVQYLRCSDSDKK
jgi:hypothetical protein